MERQTNLPDCGAYALAYATELACGEDPSIMIWDTSKMRKHITDSEKNEYVLATFSKTWKKEGWISTYGCFLS